MALRGTSRHGAETLGGWCALANSMSAEIVGRAGFDWVCIDAQHGAIGLSDLVAMLQAVDAAGVPAFVRVPWNDPAAIAHALDSGATGVIVTMVNKPEDALRAASACRYAPAGARSYGPTRAAVRNPQFSASQANAEVVCVVQIETEEAVARVDEIAAIDGIDAPFVGPADLALSLGTEVGSVTSDGFRRAARRTVSAAIAHGIGSGNFLRNDRSSSLCARGWFRDARGSVRRPVPEGGRVRGAADASPEVDDRTAVIVPTDVTPVGTFGTSRARIE